MFKDIRHIALTHICVGLTVLIMLLVLIHRFYVSRQNLPSVNTSHANLLV